MAITPINKNGLLKATIMHKRLYPKTNQFNYSLYYLSTTRKLLKNTPSALLGFNRFSLLSFYDKDHGKRNGKNSEQWVRNILKKHNITHANGEITVVTLPRILGYVFNPVSFWFCFNTEQALCAVIAEVNNTFNETHSYLITNPNQNPITKNDWITAKKAFHVSPFFNVEGIYKFRFAYSKTNIGIWINYEREEGNKLYTSITGKRIPLTTKNIIKLFFSIPFITIKTILLIHYQALKLWGKGATYYKKPRPPDKEVSE